MKSFPIAPEISELQHYVSADARKRKNSKSKSPSKVLSKSPDERSKGSKLKRKMIDNIVKGSGETVWLTVM